MKFAFVLLAVLALTTCNTELEASIDREQALQCIRYAEPILEDIVEVVAIFQEKNYGQLIPKLVEVVEHVKETIGKCIGQKSADVVLQQMIIDPMYNIRKLFCKIFKRRCRK